MEFTRPEDTFAWGPVFGAWNGDAGVEVVPVPRETSINTVSTVTTNVLLNLSVFFVIANTRRMPLHSVQVFHAMTLRLEAGDMATPIICESCRDHAPQTGSPAGIAPVGVDGMNEGSPEVVSHGPPQTPVMF